jgi:hypothetical protein
MSHFNPRFAKPEVDPCGVRGCARPESFEPKKFWEEQAKEPAPAP